MNRKLLLLDVVLVAVVIYAGLRLRDEWRAARARQAATLKRTAKPLQPPAFAPLAPESPVLATEYANIAQKTLFDKSRNPDVPVEIPAPPPKPPMPPLPVYHGIMNLGGPPVAILSVTATSAHQAVHPGETIGQFKLLDVNSVEMTLEWNGEVVRKRVDELSARMNPQPQPAAEPARTETAAPAPPPPAPAAKAGPGDTTQFGFKTCSVNDGQADGAVQDGYRKVMHSTPFGQSCTWEPVGK